MGSRTSPLGRLLLLRDPDQSAWFCALPDQSEAEGGAMTGERYRSTTQRVKASGRGSDCARSRHHLSAGELLAWSSILRPTHRLSEWSATTER